METPCRQNYRTTFLAHSSTFPARIYRVIVDVEASGGKGGTSKRVGGSNGKLPLRTCLGCSVPEPNRSPDWALVPAQNGPKGLNNIYYLTCIYTSNFTHLSSFSMTNTYCCVYSTRLLMMDRNPV